MRDAPRLLIRCDAAPKLGGGHVMRCLTLANEMAAAGWEIAFATSRESGETVPALLRSPHRVIALDDLADPTACLAAAGQDWDVALVDQYALDPSYETALRAIAGSIAVIDDLLRPHDCDLLVDMTHGRTAAEYQGLVPAHAALACGTEYAMLRPEFARLRPGSLARRDARPAERLLISLGLTDVGGITSKVLEKTVAIFPGRIDVILGANAPSRAMAEAMAEAEDRVKLHIDTPDMATLMAEADLAIGAGGTTSWERCCLGLPTLLFTLADNQCEVAAMLAQAGAIQRVDLDTVAGVLATLVDTPDQHQKMAEDAAKICDGSGTTRVRMKLDALTPRDKGTPSESALECRMAVEADRADVWLWRNDPAARSLSGNSEPIPWESHCTWWQAALADPHRILLIVSHAGQSVGHVRFDLMDGDAPNQRVSIALAPYFRGRGLGAAVLANGIQARRAKEPGAIFHAEIHNDNLASRRIFERCGFRHVSDRPPFGHYILEGRP